MLEMLAFRTAAPFGYIAFWGGLLLVASIGLALAVSAAVRPRLRPWGFVVGLGLLSAVGVFAGANIWFDVALELNPHPIDGSEILGTWRDGNAVLIVDLDGTFRLDPGWLADRLGGGSSQGRWILDDWNLDLFEDTGRNVARLRVIQFAREYRIIVNDFGDPDVWDGRLGFRLERGAAGEQWPLKRSSA